MNNPIFATVCVVFMLLVNGMRSSDPSVDPHAVKILREISDLAKESVPVLAAGCPLV